MSKLRTKILNFFWNNKIISNKIKEFIYARAKIILKNGKKIKLSNKDEKKYIKQILNIQFTQNINANLKEEQYIRQQEDSKIIAYYLPQYYPTDYNNQWWGKGTTEWTNVAKAIPQYLEHYQPRLPADLGYYDLRIDENIIEQVNLAKRYAIYGFCYYFYWFDGKRLLDVPLDKFVNNENIDFPFCLCWVNENWTRQWNKSSEVVLMKQNKDIQSYKNFIHEIKKYITHKNYIKIKNKKVLNIYRPLDIPNPKEIIKYWRETIKNYSGDDLYIIAVFKDAYKLYENLDIHDLGFDALSEFAPGPQREFCKNITQTKKFVTNVFTGNIYDYEDLVNKQKYFYMRLNNMYRAVTPMWDNTARRSTDSLIFDNSTPELFEKWISDIIKENKSRNDIDDNIIFVNAWNEWAEGAYLEPDKKYGHSYLNAILNAVLKNR